ncbi:MAG: response regulator [Actinomycetota bacterium]
MKVLIVDDEILNRRLVRRLIEEKTTFKVVGEASNGFEAVAAVRVLRPDVVVMDVEMPELNGIEATRFIRQNYPHVQVLAFTSAADDKSRIAMNEAGAIGYILKGERDQLVYTLRAAQGRVVDR